MSSELSQEMREELMQDIRRDAQRILERTQQIYTSEGTLGNLSFRHTDLEQLTYITEQIRLKLRLLGAPRIYP